MTIGLAVALFVAGLLLSTAIVALVLVLLPPGHFESHGTRVFWGPWWRILLLVLKNLGGLALVVVGVALSIPGVPGQGLLTIFAGLLLLDLPGKRRLELSILRRRPVRAAVDRLRARFGREPLRLPEGGSDAGPTSPPAC
jgi:hypothetical protein